MPQHSPASLLWRRPETWIRANDLSNLQLQPWPEAAAKDRREAEVCRAYCEGDQPGAGEEFVSPGMAVKDRKANMAQSTTGRPPEGPPSS